MSKPTAGEPEFLRGFITMEAFDKPASSTSASAVDAFLDLHLLPEELPRAVGASGVEGHLADAENIASYFERAVSVFN